MFINTVNPDEYINLMHSLSEMTLRVYSVENSDEYKMGVRILGIEKKTSSIKNIIKSIKNEIDKAILSHKLEVYNHQEVPLEQPNYFSDKRIAVYTSFFGKYDLLENPVYKPNNVDFYVITDQDVAQDSIWKKIDYRQYLDDNCNLSNVEKNRWFKMFPHKVFTEYEFSVYIDANIVPVTDFTEFVNRIGHCGIAMFKHSVNDCIYQEALFNKYKVKKIPACEIDNQVKYLNDHGMPHHYGMSTCNVIARSHSNQVCKKMMEDWWSEFMRGCKRDQLSFSFVAWKNDVKMNDITVLGSNSWKNGNYYVKEHCVKRI